MVHRGLGSQYLSNKIAFICLIMWIPQTVPLILNSIVFSLFKIQVTYTLFDMADQNSWLWRDVEAAVSCADLVTFVKSMSAVQTFIAGHKIGTGAIPAVMRAMKPGAIVLYIDNMRDESNMIFMQMCRDEGKTGNVTIGSVTIKHRMSESMYRIRISTQWF